VTRPTFGELLRGVRTGLEGAVLPALPQGAASRQLKAALTLLRRLERSWDRRIPYLLTDVSDIAASLAAIAVPLARGDGSAGACACEVLERLRDGACGPLHERDAVADIERLDGVHLSLRQAIVDLEGAVRRDASLDTTRRADTLTAFAALHRRMLGRELHALGLGEPGVARASGTGGDAP